MNKKENQPIGDMLEILAQMIADNCEQTKNLEISQKKFLENLKQSISHQISYHATQDLNRRIAYLGECHQSHIRNMNSIRADYRETFISFRNTLDKHKKSYLISYVGMAFSFFLIGFCIYDIAEQRATVSERDKTIQLNIKYFNKFLNEENLGGRFLRWESEIKK